MRRSSRAGATSVQWRTVEWWCAGAALFLMSGAVFPLMIAGGAGLGAAERSKLQLLSVPTYCLILILTARHLGQLRLALRRNLPLVVLLTLPFVSVAWSIYPMASLRRAMALAMSMMLSFVLAVRFTPRQLVFLVSAVLGSCFVLSLLFAGAAPRLGWMPDGSGMRGVFVHKNVLGWYAAVGAVTSASLIVDAEFTSRRVAVVLAGLSLICLGGSGSATATITVASAAAVAAFYFVLARMRGIARMVFALIFIQLLALVLVAMAEFVVPSLEAMGKDATLTGRVPLWALVDEEIRRRPLLGVGYQAFWTEANPDAWRIWGAIGWPAPHAHNGYRDLLLSFGIVGFVIFVVAAGRGILQGGQLLCRAPREGWLWLNVLVAMVLIMNMTESYLLQQNDFLFILFVAALIMFGFRLPGGARTSPTGEAAHASRFAMQSY